MTDRITRRLVARGRVQGVWFRESMRQEAVRLGVDGWVCNQHDGSVEAVMHGAPHAVDALIEWARHGPPDARVDSVEVTETRGEFAGFEKRPTP